MAFDDAFNLYPVVFVDCNYLFALKLFELKLLLLIFVETLLKPNELCVYWGLLSPTPPGPLTSPPPVFIIKLLLFNAVCLLPPNPLALYSLLALVEGPPRIFVFGSLCSKDFISPPILLWSSNSDWFLYLNVLFNNCNRSFIWVLLVVLFTPKPPGAPEL